MVSPVLVNRPPQEQADELARVSVGTNTSTDLDDRAPFNDVEVRRPTIPASELDALHNYQPPRELLEERTRTIDPERDALREMDAPIEGILKEMKRAADEMTAEIDTAVNLQNRQEGRSAAIEDLSLAV